MGNWLSDYGLPVVGGLAGSYFGGPWGAAGGAAGGRFVGGLLKDEDTASNITNSAVAGGIGYGGASAYNKLADNWLSGNFSSMGNLPATGEAGAATAGAQAASGAGGMFGNMKMPAAMMGINALAQMYGANSAKSNAQDVYNQQLANWQNTAYPNSATVDAQSASAMSGINQQSMLARQKLMDQMAARGMGANSGIIAGATAEEDRARRNRLAQLANQLIQFRNTPMYAPPQLQYTQSSGEKLADTVGSSTGLLAGMSLYNSMR
jgi:hypothetical protein